MQERPIERYQNCKNYKIYENCKIYDNSQDHLQNQRNISRRLQGRPIESNEIDEIYENCEMLIYDNSPDHLQNQRNIFRGLQGRPIESNENYKIYDNSQDHRQNQQNLGKLRYLGEFASPSMEPKEIIQRLR